MPVELSSFDVIIGMDWLANHHAVIVCDEKIVRIPYEDEVLIVQGDRSDKGKKSKLSIISCTKTQKYIKRGCLIFLAQVTKKETEDKSEEKRLEDMPTLVLDFPQQVLVFVFIDYLLVLGNNMFYSPGRLSKNSLTIRVDEDSWLLMRQTRAAIALEDEVKHKNLAARDGARGEMIMPRDDNRM
ncbi:putative reverse transcriptase domain-containing protein [Tanacetum coccineum]